jgi:hypothetical protein
MTRSGGKAPDTLMTLSPVDIDERPWQPVTDCPGVFGKELWRRGGFVDALIRYEPRSSTPGGPHPAADHHIWVVSGEASIAGQRVGAGAYVYVPAAVAHPIDNIGPDGCTLLQMQRPTR